MYRILVFQVLISIVLLHSCERESIDYCEEMGRQEGPIPYESLSEIVKDSIDCWLSVKDTVLYYEPILYRIDDQETFDSLVLCDSNYVEINFANYTLLIGHFFVHHGPGTIREKRVELYCDTEDQGLLYRILIDIPEKIPDTGTLIQHHIFIPKLPHGLNVSHTIDLVKLYNFPAQAK
ncbi:MAG: hypothetical protein QNK33_07710 [Bacteroidales bacterium]|nr:hypothetical protein [Bacteroidales bacterium]